MREFKLKNMAIRDEDKQLKLIRVKSLYLAYHVISFERTQLQAMKILVEEGMTMMK
jgi:hypothetical protein